MSPEVSTNNSALREWEKSHERNLEEKKKLEIEFTNEQREKIQTQLVEWYKRRDDEIKKKRQQNRSSEAQEGKLQDQSISVFFQEDGNTSGTSWQRVCDLIESSSDNFNLTSSFSRLAVETESKSLSSGAKLGRTSNSSLSNNSTNSSSNNQSNQQQLIKSNDRMRQVLLKLKNTQCDNGGNSSVNRNNSERLYNGINDFKNF